MALGQQQHPRLVQVVQQELSNQQGSRRLSTWALMVIWWQTWNGTCWTAAQASGVL